MSGSPRSPAPFQEALLETYHVLKEFSAQGEGTFKPPAVCWLLHMSVKVLFAWDLKNSPLRINEILAHTLLAGFSFSLANVYWTYSTFFLWIVSKVHLTGKLMPCFYFHEFLISRLAIFHLSSLFQTKGKKKYLPETQGNQAPKASLIGTGMLGFSFTSFASPR